MFHVRTIVNTKNNSPLIDLPSHSFRGDNFRHASPCSSSTLIRPRLVVPGGKKATSVRSHFHSPSLLISEAPKSKNASTKRILSHRVQICAVLSGTPFTGTLNTHALHLDRDRPRVKSSFPQFRGEARALVRQNEVDNECSKARVQWTTAEKNPRGLAFLFLILKTDLN